MTARHSTPLSYYNQSKLDVFPTNHFGISELHFNLRFVMITAISPRRIVCLRKMPWITGEPCSGTDCSVFPATGSVSDCQLARRLLRQRSRASPCQTNRQLVDGVSTGNIRVMTLARKPRFKLWIWGVILLVGTLRAAPTTLLLAWSSTSDRTAILGLPLNFIVSVFLAGGLIMWGHAQGRPRCRSWFFRKSSGLTPTHSIHADASYDNESTRHAAAHRYCSGSEGMRLWCDIVAR